MSDEKVIATGGGLTARYALVVLAVVNAVNYMDRSVVTILFPLIKQDLSLSDTELGLIGGLAFTLFYAVMALPMGWATDRFNRKYVISTGVLVWSLATFASGLAGRFSTFFIARSLTGTGEATCHPCGVSIISDYFGPKVRTMAIAVFQMGIPLGSGLGIVLGGILAAKLGWRQTFFIYAIPGLILLPFILFIKEPKRGAADPLATIDQAEAQTDSFSVRVRRVLSTRSLVIQYMAALVAQFGIQAFAVWMPTYLYRAKGVDIGTAGQIMGAAFLVGGIVGALGGAKIADRWFQKDKTARVNVQALSIGLCIPFILVAIFSTSFWVLVPAIFLSSILAMACYPVCSAIIIDLVGPQDRGTAMALLLIVQNGIGLTLASLTVGAISDLTGSLLYGILMAPVAFFLVVLLCLVIRRHVVADMQMIEERVGRSGV